MRFLFICKKVKLFYSIFIICCIVISCTTDNNGISEGKVINVVFDDKNSLQYSKYFSQLEFIPLETNQNNLFRTITDIRIKEGKIFVFSKAPDNMISTYDMFGYYLNSMRNTGRGPGEIYYATSFDVDTCIMVLDRGNRKILNYSFDCNYISEINLKNLYFSKFSILSDNKIVLFDEMPFKQKMNDDLFLNAKLTFWKYNNNLKINQIAHAPDLNSGKEIHILLKNSYSIYDNNLFYWDVFNDTINKVDLSTYKSNTFKVLNFGDSKIPKATFDNAFRDEIHPHELLKVIKKGYAYIYDYSYCDNDLEFFIIRKNFKDFTGLKKENELELNTFLKINLDNIHRNLEVSIAPQALYPIHYDKQGSIYFSWNAVDFINTFKKLKSQLNIPEWNSILSSHASLKNTLEKIRIDDNPIILKFTFN